MSTVISSSMVHRWTRASRLAVWGAGVVLLALAVLPGVLGAGAVDRLTALFIYVIMAAMWNALAGYGGLVSVGQQLFFGLGAYFTVRLAESGLDPFLSMVVASLGVAVFSYPLSLFMLRLKGGEFAIGMWVVSALTHLMVNLDGLIQGETGRSLISLNAYASDMRRDIIYWLALAAMTGLLAGLFALLRSRTGAAIQAIRDSEEAAGSLGIDVVRTKRLIFVLAGFGIGVAGALWLASATSFQPKTYFSVQWTAYMIFMVLVGGIGRFEGAILGAVIFFAIETWFGALGVWYLIGLGIVALLFSLFLPRGLWGEIETRLGISLMPVGYRLEIPGSTSKE
jgi:branched-chain amino acid transport system permease protein